MRKQTVFFITLFITLQHPLSAGNFFSKILEKKKDLSVKSIHISRDGKDFLCLSQFTSKYKINYNNKNERLTEIHTRKKTFGPFNGFKNGDFVFSKENLHWAWYKKNAIWHNGKLKVYRDADIFDLKMHPSGRLAVTYKKKNDFFVRIENIVCGPYRKIENVIFSDNGKSFAVHFNPQNSRKEGINVNGREFFPKGHLQRILAVRKDDVYHVSSKDSKEHIFKNETILHTLHDKSYIRSRHFMIDKGYAVTFEKASAFNRYCSRFCLYPFETYKYISSYKYGCCLGFASHRRYPEFGGAWNYKTYVDWNGKATGPYSYLARLYFSGNGNSLAIVYHDNNKKSWERKKFIKIGSRKYGGYDWLPSPYAGSTIEFGVVFSRDSTSHAFLFGMDRKHHYDYFINFNGTNYKSAQEIKKIIISPDNAFFAALEKGYYDDKSRKFLDRIHVMEKIYGLYDKADITITDDNLIYAALLKERRITIQRIPNP